MYRYNSKKFQPDDPEFYDDNYFSNRFKDIYSNMPSILNFDINTNLSHNEEKNKSFKIPITVVPATPKQNKPEDIKKPIVPEKKCGVKTLLNTRSKIVYPFDQGNNDNKNNIANNESIKDTIRKYIKEPINEPVTVTKNSPTVSKNEESKKLVKKDDVKIPGKEGIKVLTKEEIKVPTEEIKVPIKESIKEYVKVPTKEEIKVPIKEEIKEEIKVPIREEIKVPIKEEIKVPTKTMQKESGLYIDESINSLIYTPTRHEFKSKIVPIDENVKELICTLNKEELKKEELKKRELKKEELKRGELKKGEIKRGEHSGKNNESVNEEIIKEIINRENLLDKENFAEIDKDSFVFDNFVNLKKKDTAVSRLISSTIENIPKEIGVMPKSSINTPSKPSIILDKIATNNIDISPKIENLSDIENIMTGKKDQKKIDIKNQNTSIVSMVDKPELTKNLIDPPSEPVVEEVVDKKSIEKAIVEKDEWPALTIDMVGISLKVVADLPTSAKLKIVDKHYLAEDNSYIGSLSRYSSGQSRDKVISFLDHLFSETERNIWFILKSIREEANVDTNVSLLQGTVYKLHIFLHRYENMRNVYKTDSSAHARLGIIRDKFGTFLNTLFRDMSVLKK